jgi:hypothetical protein
MKGDDVSSCVGNNAILVKKSFIFASCLDLDLLKNLYGAIPAAAGFAQNNPD